jgi:LacI family transcriptional regulator
MLDGWRFLCYNVNRLRKRLRKRLPSSSLAFVESKDPVPTIREVAERAHVSPTTVSHVINKTRFVSKETRERVLLALEELGYKPNELARSLRSGKTFTLGLILPDNSNPFFAEISRGIESSAFEADYSVILCNTEGNQEREEFYVDLLLKKQVDGLIFVAAGDRADSLYSLVKRKIPVIIVDRNVPGPEVDAVLVDNITGGWAAVRYLIELGHRRIACITGPSNVTPSSGRVIGYRKALTEANIPVDETLISQGNFRIESGEQIALELLQRADRPSAIFACNDLMAIGAMRAANRLELDIPGDVSIIGYDDIELARYVTPLLTTVFQPKSLMGQVAVKLLLDRMENIDRPKQVEVLQPELVIRESCGAIA